LYTSLNSIQQNPDQWLAGDQSFMRNEDEAPWMSFVEVLWRSVSDHGRRTLLKA
jgi:hypothetical protein